MAEHYRNRTSQSLTDLTEPSFNRFWMTGRGLDEPRSSARSRTPPAPPASTSAYADMYYSGKGWRDPHYTPQTG
jgi:hypothetical protein